MRIWGRTYTELGVATWVPVTTSPSGNNEALYFTNLIQCLKLNLAESPLYANYGIPAQRSVLTQIFPDFYTYQTQQQFAQYFVSLTVRKIPSPTPTYDVTAVTHSGAIMTTQVPA